MPEEGLYEESDLKALWQMCESGDHVAPEEEISAPLSRAHSFDKPPGNSSWHLDDGVNWHRELHTRSRQRLRVGLLETLK